MKKVKIGVMGVGRGRDMISYCTKNENAELVAVCDKWEEGLERFQRKFPKTNVAVYRDFDEFLKHDMDAVVLANYANEHAPFAIRCLKAGKHVFSEVLPVQTMKEAVELIEAVEETGLIYAYGENYCYMAAPREMRKLYRENKIGELEYAECEYVHNCESIWPEITRGEEDHWRNTMFSTFYCTHSLGPVVHISGLRPVSVVGFEGTKTERNLRIGTAPRVDWSPPERMQKTAVTIGFISMPIPIPASTEIIPWRITFRKKWKLPSSPVMAVPTSIPCTTSWKRSWAIRIQMSLTFMRLWICTCRVFSHTVPS